MPRILVIVAVLFSACVGDAAPPPITSTPNAAQETAATSSSTSTVSSSTSSPGITATGPDRGWLVIHGVGDVNLDGDVISALRVEGYEHAWSGLNGLFLDDDLSIINLECSPSPDGPREPKEFVFGCDVDAYPPAVAAGVDVANIGNNHSQDHGKEAMLEGRAIMQDVGLNPVGAGVDAGQAGQPAIVEVNGWTIAVIGFGGVFPHEGWFATDDRPGMRDGDTIETMVEQFRLPTGLPTSLWSRSIGVSSSTQRHGRRTANEPKQ